VSILLFFKFGLFAMQSFFCYFFKPEGCSSLHWSFVDEWLKAFNNNDPGKKNF
jgi:hypothetical protein